MVGEREEAEKGEKGGNGEESKEQDLDVINWQHAHPRNTYPL